MNCLHDFYDELGRYASRKSLLAIELLNEESAQVHFETLKKYYKAGYDAVNRQVQLDDVYVIMSGRLMQNGATEIVAFASGFKKCVIDVHYYNVYDSKFEIMNVDQNIDCEDGPSKPSEESGGGKWCTCLCWVQNYWSLQGLLLQLLSRFHHLLYIFYLVGPHLQHFFFLTKIIMYPIKSPVLKKYATWHFHFLNYINIQYDLT